MKIHHVAASTLERAVAIGKGDLRIAVLAALNRINTLYMVAAAGSGHLGSSFSSLDIMTWLWFEELKTPNSKLSGSDLFFSSKGHDAPGLYSVLIADGKIPLRSMHRFRRLEGLPGHPDVGIPVLLTNTGSLGMGISKALGFLAAKNLMGDTGRVFVLTGDGELQEGQLWESLQPAANSRLAGLRVIVDHNKIQSDALVSETSDLGDLEAKFAAFGWLVGRVDGHDVAALRSTLRKLESEAGERPIVIIADTTKGKGVDFMEHLVTGEEGTYYKFHSGAPSEMDYAAAFRQLDTAVREILGPNYAEVLEYVTVDCPTQPPVPEPLRLVPEYTRALLELAETHPELVALDADLVLDTGLIPFKNRFPQRYFECGIAEQHMVSMAGAMALKGVLPIVHSFSCFLTTRAQEQIFNNSTEKTKIIYVGSLSGVFPSGPGHSHQSLRDIHIMDSIPGLTVIEPSTPDEVVQALRWAVEAAIGPVFIRLTSIPLPGSIALPPEDLVPGRGRIVRGTSGPILLTFGPVMLAEALAAAEFLGDQGVAVRVVTMPWWNCFDPAWWSSILSSGDPLFLLENAAADRNAQLQLLRLLVPGAIHFRSIPEIPPCGWNSEVKDYLGITGKQIAEWVGESTQR